MKEGTKTAEEVLYTIDSIARDYDPYEYGLPTHDVGSEELMKRHLEQYAEQARMEERERHKDIVNYVVGHALGAGEYIELDGEAEKLLAAAGYGKEEVDGNNN